MTTLVTHSEKETQEAGRALSQQLEPGDVVAIVGDLGAGKTRFIQGICSGLGIGGHVASPTFTIVHEYHNGSLTVFHFDFYRIRAMEEIVDLGFEDYLRPDTICLIEWAEKAFPMLPDGRYNIVIRLGEKPNIREINIDRKAYAAA